MIKWDDYWKDYSISKAEKFLISERNKIINKYINRIDIPQKKVLEVGCGFGSNLRLLNEVRKDISCYALDYSFEAIKSLKDTIDTGVVADCRMAAFPDKTFDLIYSSGLMEHFKDEIPFLTEMKRLLKDDGYLITIVPGRYSLWELYQLLHFGNWKHGYEKSYTYNILESTFRENRYRIMEIKGIDPFSIAGFIMKIFNISFEPFVKRSFSKSGYTELCLIATKY